VADCGLEVDSSMGIARWRHLVHSKGGAAYRYEAASEDGQLEQRSHIAFPVVGAPGAGSRACGVGESRRHRNFPGR
jgi:hypothetical protein